MSVLVIGAGDDTSREILSPDLLYFGVTNEKVGSV